MRIVSIILVALLLCISGSCTRNYTQELHTAIAEHVKNDKESLDKIAYLLLKKNSHVEIAEKKLALRNDHIFSKGKEKVRFYYPVKSAVSIDTVKPRLFFINKKYAVYSDRHEVVILDNSNKETVSARLSKKKHVIRALIVYMGKVYFYRNLRLYVYDIAKKTAKRYTKEKFLPPYIRYYRKFRNDFRVKMIKKGSLLGVLVGNGGSYYFNLIDMNDSSVKITNLAVASRKITFNKKSITYMSGNAGRWKCMRISLPAKKKKVLCIFKKLADIVLLQQGYILVTKKNNQISGYDCKPLAVPGIYRVHGTVRDNIVLSYGQKVFVGQFASFLKDLRMVEKKVPELFKKK